MRDWIFIYGCFTLVIAVVLAGLLPLAGDWLVATTFGTYLVVDAFLIYFAGREDTDRKGHGFLPLEVEGGLAGVFGLFAWVSPLISAITTAQLLGVWYVIASLLTLTSSRSARHRLRRPGALIAASLVSFVFGVYLLARPMADMQLQASYVVFLGVFGALNIWATRGLRRESDMAYSSR
jgi:uncharacterized membrane protein HdeD (DUF308 family)